MFIIEIVLLSQSTGLTYQYVNFYLFTFNYTFIVTKLFILNRKCTLSNLWKYLTGFSFNILKILELKTWKFDWSNTIQICTKDYDCCRNSTSQFGVVFSSMLEKGKSLLIKQLYIIIIFLLLSASSCLNIQRQKDKHSCRFCSRWNRRTCCYTLHTGG